jgi:small-conductance mechanosensitive channel
VDVSELAVANLGEWATAAYEWLTRPLFSVGGGDFSFSTLIKMLLFVVVLFWSAGAVRKILAGRVLPKLKLDQGINYALANIAAYLFIALGLMVGLQSFGIDLSTLTVLFGALGVGIGLDLQAIASNFISGLILLIERPIQIGDRIEIGELHGEVKKINIRATEVLTNDRIAVIIPNQEFVTQQVINWSRGGDTLRHKIPVGVAYGSDPVKVRDALLEAAAAVDGALSSPPPRIRLAEFADSALVFEVVIWTSELLHRRGEFRSRVNYAVHDALDRHGIEIPFPQRDLHLKTAPGWPAGVAG